MLFGTSADDVEVDMEVEVEVGGIYIAIEMWPMRTGAAYD